MTRVASASSDTLPTFQVWKTVTIGQHADLESILSALESSWRSVLPRVRTELKAVAFTPSAERIEYDLVRVSDEDLGSNSTTTNARRWAAAARLGLELCPTEVGLQLALDYLDQPKGETLIVAGEGYVNPHGLPQMISVVHLLNMLVVSTRHGHPDFVAEISRDTRMFNRYVFVRPRK